MYDEGADEFLATFLGVAMRPRSTLARLEKEKGAVLPLALTEQYKYQVWYQGRCFSWRPAW